MAWLRGWGQDTWGKVSPWGSPTTGWFSSNDEQAYLVGQYLTIVEAKDMQFGGHVIFDMFGNEVFLDDSALTTPGGW